MKDREQEIKSTLEEALNKTLSELRTMNKKILELDKMESSEK